LANDERVDVVTTAGEHGADAAEDTGFVGDKDAESVGVDRLNLGGWLDVNRRRKGTIRHGVKKG
jgi:hypothetical protein